MNTAKHLSSSPMALKKIESNTRGRDVGALTEPDANCSGGLLKRALSSARQEATCADGVRPATPVLFSMQMHVLRLIRFISHAGNATVPVGWLSGFR